MAGTIVAGGGKQLGTAVDGFLLELGGPRICFVPTALGDASWSVVAFYESFGHRAEASHAAFYPWPREDLREHVLSRDVVYVAGGSMVNMLAIWRARTASTASCGRPGRRGSSSPAGAPG
jgi:peptidase E